jgi:multidrug efflux pump
MEPARRSLIARLAEGSARRWKVTFVVWAGVLVLGLYAYFGGLAREGFPPIDLPIVVVDGVYFVDDAEKVDRDVTVPLAAAYAEIEGVTEIQTFALQSGYAVVVEFETGFTSPEGAALLTAAEPDLGVPATVVVRSLDATKFADTYDILVSVSAPAGATASELQAQAEALAAALATENAIEVAEVRDLVTEAIDPATGIAELRTTRFTRVAFGGDESYREAVAIGLIRNPELNLDVVEFSDAVASALDGDLRLGDGFEAAITADFANDIKAQLSSLTGNLLTGLIAVAIVSLLLIGWRTAIITAAFMATVMLSSLLALLIAGYSLNTITLFGLILTLGLLVDDAIVVTESIDANRDDPAPDVDIAEVGVVRTAISRVGTASFSGTLTTVLVFAPLMFVGGILGEFIRAIPVTVIITLLLSFVFSMTFIPAIASRFLLSGSGGRSPLLGVQTAAAKGLGRLASYPGRKGAKGILVGFGLVVLAFGIVFSSFGTAAKIGFNIFPQPKDTNGLLITGDFDEGLTLDDAAAISTHVDEAVLEVLGDDLVRSQYVQGNERGTLIFIDLVPFDDRNTTAPTYVERLEDALVNVEGVRLSVSTFGTGPPSEDFPFAAQISVGDSNNAAGEQLAIDIKLALTGADLDKLTGDPTTIQEVILSTEGVVFRNDGVQQIEIRASFDTDDTTNNLNAAELLLADLFPAGELESRGLAPDALSFDFGQESDNQDDFASLGSALLIALVLMLILLTVQFRSLAQALLIFLAIPFSFFGVFNILDLTDNTLSFFVAVGFIALIGVVVNNTILLVDAANQARRVGHGAADSIRQAVESRFRPLLATTATTVAGLLPLALSDPFWEGLSFTLIGGLVSSTIMVLVVFPVFYLMVEAVRTPVRNLVRGWMGRERIS